MGVAPHKGNCVQSVLRTVLWYILIVLFCSFANILHVIPFFGSITYLFVCCAIVGWACTDDFHIEAFGEGDVFKQLSIAKKAESSGYLLKHAAFGFSTLMIHSVLWFLKPILSVTTEIGMWLWAKEELDAIRKAQARNETPLHPWVNGLLHQTLVGGDESRNTVVAGALAGNEKTRLLGGP